MRGRWHITGSMTEIVIPDPSLVILVGAAGSGKSTFATRHFRPSEILSSDAMRVLISGDEADQHATDAAFGRLHRELERRLQERLLTVVDATNVERRARRALLARAVAAGVSGEARGWAGGAHHDWPQATDQARRAQRLTDATPPRQPQGRADGGA